MTSKFCTTVMFTIFNIHKTFHTKRVVMFTICLLIKFYITYSNGLLVTAIKIKHNPRIQTAVYCYLHSKGPKRKRK
jgi:hypothetical protein